VEAVRNTDTLAMFNLDKLAAKGQAGDVITSKPWSSTSYPPSELPPLNLTPTAECLQLEWVFGYHSQVLSTSNYCPCFVAPSPPPPTHTPTHTPPASPRPRYPVPLPYTGTSEHTGMFASASLFCRSRATTFSTVENWR
jgi:hypothetical protein